MFSVLNIRCSPGLDNTQPTSRPPPTAVLHSGDIRDPSYCKLSRCPCGHKVPRTAETRGEGSCMELTEKLLWPGNKKINYSYFMVFHRPLMLKVMDMYSLDYHDDNMDSLTASSHDL